VEKDRQMPPHLSRGAGHWVLFMKEEHVNTVIDQRPKDDSVSKFIVGFMVSLCTKLERSMAMPFSSLAYA
jgi:hypothetical protein